MNESNKVSRVQIEPERVGWTRLADLVRQKDRDRIDDVKEDIDTLLVFVRLSVLPLYPLFDMPLLRLVYSQQSFPHLSSRRTPNSLRILRPRTPKS